MTKEQASAAGKRGALTVKERLGEDHFQRMGKVGGTATREKYGADFYKQIGSKGGAVARARPGTRRRFAITAEPYLIAARLRERLTPAQIEELVRLLQEPR